VSAFAGWENFYVIVGSSAGALIGLQFVVITLIANRPVVAGQALGADAFATPTIVHFGTVLLLSAILNAPWHGVVAVAFFLGFLGVAGIVYAVIVVWRMRKQTVYAPEFEDWLFHFLLPFAAYATLAGSGFAVLNHSRAASFCIAAAALLLLFVGIHNAWDAVTYHIFSGKHVQGEGQD
jgi:hypothetical protein